MPTPPTIPPARPVLDREAILHHPLFPEIERRIARHLMASFTNAPRLARLFASHRKWMMSNAMYALTLKRRPDDPLSGLTVTRFVDLAVQLEASSRNTAMAYLAELVAYKYLREIDDVPDKRVRLLVPTETAEGGMVAWYLGHLVCLDMLDGGNRADLCRERPEIFHLSHPLIANSMLTDPLWRNPPPSIGHFVHSEMGSILLHDLISRLPDAPDKDRRYGLGVVHLGKLSETYMMSPTNLKRLFRKAEVDGVVGWYGHRRMGELWLSHVLVDDHFQWQATKFAAIEAGFQHAIERLGITLGSQGTGVARREALEG